MADNVEILNKESEKNRVFFRFVGQGEKFPKEDIEDGVVSWLLWRIWKNRNEFVFQGRDYDVIATVVKAREDEREWRSREEVKKDGGQTAPKEEPVRRWRPPPPTWIKCNTDGAWNKESRDGGVGWIARDHQGNLVWAGARKLSNMRSALEVEVEACRWAVQTLSGFGYTRVIIETDSLMLKRLITKEEAMWPTLQPLLQEISLLMAENRGFEMVFAPRSGNKVADRIAKETSTFASFVPKLYSVLVWLSSLVESEKSLYEL
ncbi:uncharacterized protein LOC125588541 [Brassica napus]|uniref:uncharacterized protein LOC125588541 n=1 Tax=Brassica napus TaxID=3708 RepID=UPI002079DA45|nr:uncharacterized protein LOC125588541 [Brassica napus]